MKRVELKQIVEWAMKHAPMLDLAININPPLVMNEDGELQDSFEDFDGYGGWTTEDGEQTYPLAQSDQSSVYGIPTENIKEANYVFGECSEQVEEVLDMFFEKVSNSYIQSDCWILI